MSPGQTAENAPRNPAGYFRTLLQNCVKGDGILTAEDMRNPCFPPAQPVSKPSSAEQLSAFDREW